jgi:hypothetical protein
MMTNDRTTKLLLLLIAAALWINLLKEWSRPVSAAQFVNPSTVLNHTSIDHLTDKAGGAAMGYDIHELRDAVESIKDKLP